LNQSIWGEDTFNTRWWCQWRFVVLCYSNRYTNK